MEDFKIGTCSRCNLPKPSTSFKPVAKLKSGHDSMCRDCRNSDQRTRNKKHINWIVPSTPHDCMLLSDIKELSHFIGYAISKEGTLFTCRKRQHGYYDKWNIISPSVTKKGYTRVTLSIKGATKDLSIHRIVALAFIPKPEGKEWINHKDSNPRNNKVDNLEWCTPKENSIHAVTFGMLPKGSKVVTSKLKENQVIEIRELREQGMKFKDIASKFNVCVGTIEKIIYKVWWNHC